MFCEKLHKPQCTSHYNISVNLLRMAQVEAFHTKFKYVKPLSKTYNKGSGEKRITVLITGSLILRLSINIADELTIKSPKFLINANLVLTAKLFTSLLVETLGDTADS
ncbi:MAG: hypothetical protein ACI9TY_001294 [Alphaproteobacteria bacterium]|jgi:hypothetical protein